MKSAATAAAMDVRFMCVPPWIDQQQHPHARARDRSDALASSVRSPGGVNASCADAVRHAWSCRFRLGRGDDGVRAFRCLLAREEGMIRVVVLPFAVAA